MRCSDTNVFRLAASSWTFQLVFQKMSEARSVRMVTAIAVRKTRHPFSSLRDAEYQETGSPPHPCEKLIHEVLGDQLGFDAQ
jgi:hypothetical protein